MVNIRGLSALAAALGLALSSVVAAPAYAASPGELDCTLHFELHGWSAFYKTSSGTGTVACSNGQQMDVTLSSKGGGVTVGRMRIDDGTGRFTGIHDIREVLGTYAAADAHAGAGTSVKASVVTKGTVSLALTGKGKGVDVGFSFGNFVISKR